MRGSRTGHVVEPEMRKTPAKGKWSLKREAEDMDQKLTGGDH